MVLRQMQLENWSGWRKGGSRRNERGNWCVCGGGGWGIGIGVQIGLHR